MNIHNTIIHLLENERTFEIEQKLKDLGFTYKKDTKTRINVFVSKEIKLDASNRLNPNSSQYIFPGIEGKYYGFKQIPGVTSSTGALVTDQGIILQLKPPPGQSIGHSGKANEDFLLQKVNSFIEEADTPVEIVLKEPNKKIVLNNIVRVIDTSRETNAKADIAFISSDDQSYRFSIKQNNAEFWGSEKSRWKDAIKKLLLRLEEKNKIKLETHKEHAEVIVVKPEVAIKLSPKDAMRVVFGDDLIGKDSGVFRQTFNDSHFIPGESTLTIEVTKIIEDLSDLDEEDWPWLIVCNNSAKPGVFGPAQWGVDVRTAIKKRVHSTAYKIDGEFDLEKI